MWHMDQTVSLVGSIRLDLFLSVLPRWMEETYHRTGDINATTEKLTDSFYAEDPDYFISPGIFEWVYLRTVPHIAKELEGQ